MSQFSQKPVHIRKRKPGGPNLFTRFRIAVQRNNLHREDRRDEKPQKNRISRPKTGSGFSFPIPSLATLAVIAGIVVIALAAFNWEHFDIRDIRTPDIYAFQPVTNSESANELVIQYAITGIPGIMGETPDIEALSFENTDKVTENENPHGMLISFEWRQYRVQRGDSVSGIAQKFGVSVGAVIASNNISNARRLQEGAVLRIPNIDGVPYQIKRGDSLSRISTLYNVPLEIILDVNDIKSDNITPGETLFIPGGRMNDIDLRLSLGESFIFPLPGRRHVTSHFGMRRDPISGVPQFHNGVDFRANTGTTVMAAMDGVVSVVSESWLYGKYIIISHSNGYKTLYGHLNSFSVKQGDRIARGRKIGESGNTGYSTGPHLHFGVYDRNNRLVNPLQLLN